MKYEDIIPPSGGKAGKIDLSKDHSRFLKKRRTKIIYMSFLLLPYLAVGVYLFFLGLEILSLVLIATPLLLMLVFWKLGQMS